MVFVVALYSSKILSARIVSSCKIFLELKLDMTSIHELLRVYDLMKGAPQANMLGVNF